MVKAQLNYTSVNKYLLEAKNKNKVIQEQVRVRFHMLPFSVIPNVTTKYLVMEAARKLNYFPPHSGISQYYSPRMIMYKLSLNYAKECSNPIFHIYRP